jgi:glycosyltransferase involved in cell wall biosynthesis
MLLPFTAFGTYGGMQSHVYSLSEQIALMGHDVSLIGESIGANKFEIINGVKRIGIKTDLFAYTNYFANFHALLNISRQVKKIEEKEEFDVFHAHGAGGALMALKSLSASNKLIITSHGLPPLYLNKNYSTLNFNFKDNIEKIFAEKILKQIGRYLYNLAYHIIAVSKHVATDVHDTYKVEWNRITVIPNGINPEKFFHNPLLKSKLIRIDDPLIIFVGAWDRGDVASVGKGLHYLIEAFEKVLRDFPSAKLAVVGEYNPESHYAQRIFHLCKKLKIDSSVFFTGHLFQDDVREYYASADVFVFSSIYEGFGITLLEAMASALPIVASEGSHLATSELIENDVTGLLYQAGNVNQLSDAIIQVLNDKALAKKLGTNAKAYAEKFFNWRVIAEKTLQIYNSV